MFSHSLFNRAESIPRLDKAWSETMFTSEELFLGFGTSVANPESSHFNAQNYLKL